MTWHSLYDKALKKRQKKKSISDAHSKPALQNSASRDVALDEEDETYQKKLFENDLYVWSLLLIGNDKV
jgi:hypothetical protein